ncbi:hypothetical protein C7451_12031 [Blastomonas natatoria]|uniref:Uncharacterized protein n=1 Tax=Blastomonas natatoria TaxID=34015 RepID=A0A2V3UQ68_9SPHN|nr:hypothetical protein C7451_12031 [Blastomonas natatoria]
MRRYASKSTPLGFALCIGPGLRWIMRRWTRRFRMPETGPDPAQEAALRRANGYGWLMACFHWRTIAGISRLGTGEPF